MTVTILGSGTIGGLVAGGLPDGTIQPADLTIGAPSWDSSGNLQMNSGYGSVATAYGCRAWVNFDGTGSVGASQTIRGSGNITSVVRNATNYTVNFTTAFPNTNYTTVTGFQRSATSDFINVGFNRSTTYEIVEFFSGGGTTSCVQLMLAWFR